MPEISNLDNEDHKVVVNCPKNSKILLRKKELFNQLDEKKLEYKKYGICDSYIKYGKPSLNDVIENIQTLTDKKLNRVLRLTKRLKKEDEIYDENISYYKNFINNGGDIEYTIQEGVKEWFYINKTNYLEFLNRYKDEDLAKAKAFNAYIRQYGYDKYTEKIRKTEMIVNIY